MTGFIEPAPHEFAANFLFDEDGLAPFFAADRQIKAGVTVMETRTRFTPDRTFKNVLCRSG
jgi:hypothetical protein